MQVAVQWVCVLAEGHFFRWRKSRQWKLNTERKIGTRFSGVGFD